MPTDPQGHPPGQACGRAGGPRHRRQRAPCRLGDRARVVSPRRRRRRRRHSVVFAEQPGSTSRSRTRSPCRCSTSWGYDSNQEELSRRTRRPRARLGRPRRLPRQLVASQEPTFGDLIDDGKVSVLSTIVTGPSTRRPFRRRGRGARDLLARRPRRARREVREQDLRHRGRLAPATRRSRRRSTRTRTACGTGKLVASGTPAMLAQVEKSQKAGELIVFLGWSPHWMTVQFDAAFLEDPDKVWGGAGRSARSPQGASRTRTRPSRVPLEPGPSPPTRRASSTSRTTRTEGPGRDRRAWIDENPDRVAEFLDGVEDADGNPAAGGSLTSARTVGRPPETARARDRRPQPSARSTACRRHAEKARALRTRGLAAAAAGGYLGAHEMTSDPARRDLRRHGPVGSGKSTVLRCSTGYRAHGRGAPDRGRGHHPGLRRPGCASLRNQKISMVFQHFSLFPHRTVRENAAYGLKVRGVGKAERREKADWALDRVGLGAAATSTRTSCPAGCGSGWAWPARWPPTRRSC